MPITRRRRASQPDQPDNNNHSSDQTENTAELHTGESAPAAQTLDGENTSASNARSSENISLPAFTPPPSPSTTTNGDRGNSEKQDYPPPIEGGRRTARGELFKRPPQPPPMPTPAPPQLQPPTHEISLPLGNLLHLAYNPGYTGADEARSRLLHSLTDESKAGGRARCWNCGSIAIVYDRWPTSSKTFGEVGIAFCEICGVWSVM